MYININFDGWRPRELLALICRNSKETREETLRRIFLTGLKNIGAEMLKKGEFRMDKLNRTEISALFSEDKESGYCGLRTSAISSGIGPSPRI